jgi:acrylyl-CoA reductase (NADPH)
MSKNFQALWVTKTDGGEYQSQITERSTDDLPAGDVLVRVAYSSLNYKDMLSTQGHPGVTQKFPHQPGIDAAGIVEECSNGQFKPGDEVIVTGYDLGMNTAGGLGQYIRVPANWVIPMPTGLSAREAMSYGTAGFTSALCLDKLIQMGAAPGDGLVAVTGATGGVGVFAVSLLAKLGYQVAAATGKPESADMLRSLGATEVFARQELADIKGPLGAPRFAHAVDALGGEYLANLLTVIDYGGSVACCGLAASPGLPATVMPFIIRDVNLLGVDCVEQPLARKQATWSKLGSDWKLDNLDGLIEEISLEQVPESLDKIKQGTVVGRYVVNMK